MARLGVPVGGRVRKLRAVEDQSTPIPEERTSKLGRTICNRARMGQGHDLARPGRVGEKDASSESTHGERCRQAGARMTGQFSVQTLSEGVQLRQSRGPDAENRRARAL